MSRKNEVLDKKRNEVFCANMKRNFELKFPECQRMTQKFMAQKLHLAEPTLNEYIKKGYPIDRIPDVESVLGCTKEELLKYDSYADLKRINESLFAVCMSTPIRVVCFVLMFCVLMLALNVNGLNPGPVTTYNSGLILGLLMIVMGNILAVDEKAIWKWISNGIGVTSILLSTMGFLSVLLG